MELNCGSHMVLLSVTAVVVNKMQRSQHFGLRKGLCVSLCLGSE